MLAVCAERARLGVLLIDAQPLFWQEMAGPQEPVLLRVDHLLMLADWLNLPLLATFEHSLERKGALPERLERLFPAHGQRLVKRAYNCCAEPAIRAAIQQLGVQQFAVAGAETDVCVLQSVLGLLTLGYEVFLLEDCLFTSEPHPRPALERMYRAGALPCTFKTLAYELTGRVDQTPWLEEAQPLPAPLPVGFLPPESLPPWQFDR